MQTANKHMNTTHSHTDASPIPPKKGLKGESETQGCVLQLCERKALKPNLYFQPYRP